MPESESPDPVEDAAALGLSVLTQIVEGTADGIFLCDAERRWVYVNAAACNTLGRSARDLISRDYVEAVPAREKPAARQYYSALLQGSTEMLTRMLVREGDGYSGEEREVVFAPFRIDVDGQPHGAALFRDFTATRAAGRTATALAQSAAELTGARSTDEILAGTARHVVEGTCALWAGLAVIEDAGWFGSAGSYGPGGAAFGPASEAYWSRQTAPAQQFLEAVTAGATRGGDAPSRAVTLTRRTWEEDPVLSGYGRPILQYSWQSAVCIPLVYDHRRTGVLVILLPITLTALSDAEVAFCTALADHASVAVANEHLSRQAARSAEVGERDRVARELHDSVSQALFAMTMHARAAELAVAKTGLSQHPPLARSLEQLSQLSRGALAEMRALIFELRPEAFADEGLLQALSTRAAAISARENLRIRVAGPTGRLPVDADVETALYQIVSEILRDVVKHAGADIVSVTLHVDERTVSITVVDDGAGVDPTRPHLDRPSLAVIAEHARTIGAVFHVSSGDGTTISIAVPVERHSQAEAGAGS